MAKTGKKAAFDAVADQIAKGKDPPKQRKSERNPGFDFDETVDAREAGAALARLGAENFRRSLQAFETDVCA